MKTIDLKGASHDVTDLLDQARADDAVVVRLADGSEFLVIALDEFEQELEKIRNHPGLIRLLELRAAQTSALSLDEVKRRLNLP